MAVAAPVIEAEMNDWTALGGGNSGIVGDPATHTYGFHLDANSVGSDDYSRWRDPNGSDGPYVNWDYACAGDFSHHYDETLRAMHRDVLARLMSGQLPMICEFIGKPWSDRPVYYWARWNGITTLKLYTGSGHDHWSHISWYRSMVDQPAHLWSTVEEDMTPDEHDNLVATDARVWYSLILGSDEYPDLSQGATQPWIVKAVKDLQAKVAALKTPVIDAAMMKAAVVAALSDPAVRAVLVATSEEGAQNAEKR